MQIELLTTKEAADFLRVSCSTVTRMINEGRLRAVKVGSQGDRRSPWRIRRADLERLVGS